MQELLQNMSFLCPAWLLVSSELGELTTELELGPQVSRISLQFIQAVPQCLLKMEQKELVLGYSR